MIKDAAAKVLLVPLLGICIAVLTMFLFITKWPLYETLLATLFWIAVTYVLWQGIVAATAAIRNHVKIKTRIALKLFLLLLCSSALALLITGIAIAFWYKLFQNPIAAQTRIRYVFLYLVVAPIIGLAYEILFLKKEQELDSKIVAQLDYERQSAELQALTNELDPHFVFNALNVLSPLIATDTAKAQVFTQKLAQTYRYLLQNKERELISLSDELHFIQDYFYLLQIRHENKLRLDLALQGTVTDTVMILPFALHALVENAIKHNQFSEEKPLLITISLNKQALQVANSINPKPYAVESTHVGLKNLSARYKLTCNRDIMLSKTKDQFLVRLPLIKTTV